MSILANLLPAMRSSRKRAGTGKETDHTEKSTGHGRRRNRKHSRH
ncbi:hypothetical protein ABT247_21225 [Kitasatospora sp. NPDC001539]